MLPINQRSKTRTVLTLAVVAGVLLLQTHPALAQISLSGNSTGTISVGVGGGALFSSGTNFLNALVTLLTTTWAQAIGVIAVVCVALAFMTGRMHLPLACSVIVGIILMFCASSIVSSIATAAQ
jgi:type IV secretory pathway VirB2 component (pilin)